MRYVRAECSQITPLEVWELPFDGRPVWQRIGARAVERRIRRGQHPHAVGRAVADMALRFARKIRRGEYPSVRAAQGGSTIWFAGGLSRLPGFENVMEMRDDIELLGCDADVLGGGYRVLEVVGEDVENAAVVDVGQTAIKCAHLGSSGLQGSVERFERPWDELPVASETGRAEGTTGKAIEFIARVVDRVVDSAPEAPSALVLALPCKVDRQLNAGRCSYGDWSRTPRFVARIIEAVDSLTDDEAVVVLNDAELAGHAAWRRWSERQQKGSGWVVTLGFGPGAAYVDAEVDGG